MAVGQGSHRPGVRRRERGDGARELESLRDRVAVFEAGDGGGGERVAGTGRVDRVNREAGMRDVRRPPGSVRGGSGDCAVRAKRHERGVRAAVAERLCDRQRVLVVDTRPLQVLRAGLDHVHVAENRLDRVAVVEVVPELRAGVRVERDRAVGVVRPTSEVVGRAAGGFVTERETTDVHPVEGCEDVVGYRSGFEPGVRGLVVVERELPVGRLVVIDEGQCRVRIGVAFDVVERHAESVQGGFEMVAERVGADSRPERRRSVQSSERDGHVRRGTASPPRERLHVRERPDLPGEEIDERLPGDENVASHIHPWKRSRVRRSEPANADQPDTSYMNVLEYVHMVWVSKAVRPTRPTTAIFPTVA